MELLTQVSVNVFRYVEANGKLLSQCILLYRKQWKIYYDCRGFATEENLRLMKLRKLRFLTGEERLPSVIFHL